MGSIVASSLSSLLGFLYLFFLDLATRRLFTYIVTFVLHFNIILATVLT